MRPFNLSCLLARGQINYHENIHPSSCDPSRPLREISTAPDILILTKGFFRLRPPISKLGDNDSHFFEKAFLFLDEQDTLGIRRMPSKSPASATASHHCDSHLMHVQLPRQILDA